MEETISRKIAALEAYKILYNKRVANILGIWGVFITAIVMHISLSWGSAIAGICAAGFGFVLWKDQEYILYLEKKYNIKRPKNIFELKNLNFYG